jgi:hypothetical protein
MDENALAARAARTIMRRFSLLLLLPPLVLGLTRQEGQEPGDVDAPLGRDVYGRPLKATGKSDELVKQLMGCWMLVDIDDAEFPPEGRTQVGYLLVGQDFLALEMHIVWDTDQGVMVDDDFQSGIHEYRIDPNGVLTTSSLIGGFLEDEGGELNLQWEDPATLRRFQTKLAGNFLTLTRSDGSRLSFSRQPLRHSKTRDVFGHETEPKKPEDAGKKK